ncbi:MAG: response regulator [Elusimicrobia bacterium]|nr:response regulator [Elusimicrobiota bacterium]
MDPQTDSTFLNRVMARSTFVIMRLTLFLAVFLFITYGEKSVFISPLTLTSLLLSFLVLAAVQMAVPERWHASHVFQAAAFLLDVALLSLVIFFSQGFNSDLYLVYFLTILMAGFTRQPWQVACVSLASSLFYGIILYLSSGGWSFWEPALLLRVPFLVLVAVFVSMYSHAVHQQSAQLAAARRELDHLREHLGVTQKLTLMGQVISGVAHELNNPLTGIIGFSQILLQNKDVQADQDLREPVEILCQEAERCQKIVRNLSAFARRHKPEKKPLQINHVVDNCVRLMRYQFLTRDIKIQRDFAHDLPRLVADPAQLQQVVLNLFTNAQQAMSDAHGRGVMTVRTRHRDGRIRLEVEDDGPGIPPDVLPRIFEPFFTTKDVDQGTGLGLSLSFEMVREQQGRIWAENKPAGGAVFIVEFPLPAESPAADVPAGAARPVLPAGLRILIVDDEPVVRDVLTRVLKKLGHRLEIAEDGEAAVQKLLGNDYDAVLSDFRMPQMDGLKLFDWAKENRPRLADRWVFMTGSIGEDMMGRIERTGRPILLKPFRLNEIESILARVVSPKS